MRVDVRGHLVATRPVLIVGLLVAMTAGMLAAARQSPRLSAGQSFAALHDETLRHAQVWVEPAVPIEQARLGDNPAGPDTFAPSQEVSCTFVPGASSGTTPKFNCALASGEIIKVKYGRANAEVYAEVAATRLLSALGFPADRMYVVGVVRCAGCPKDPFVDLQCLNAERATIDGCFPHVDYAHHEDFDTAVFERSLKGRRIDTAKIKGWSWEELGKIDPAVGGATRAQVDALRLMAIVLGHWDNKSDNQRLLCLGEPARSMDCRHPLAMIQDLGATFGPRKLDLAQWAKTPVWADAKTCSVSMHAMPYGGSTFPDARISEQGRAFLADRLRRFSHEQIHDLFAGARVDRDPRPNAAGHEVEAWVSAFEAKVRAIVDRAPCPGP